MSGSFIDSEIDSIVEKFSDEPVIKVLKLLDWSRINKLSNKAKLINVGKHRIPYSPVLMTKIFYFNRCMAIRMLQWKSS
ncbi:MAG: hypothetical protein RBS16_09200 [Candidatus Cloacimonadales bacterium]|jgi:hypothetical protein|nr:hypothetical protein [Candidatus Cloacimonadales bacterium]